MVTDRYEGAHGVQPASLVAALGLSAAMVGGLVLSNPAVQKQITKVLVASNIPIVRPTPEPTPETPTVVALKPQPLPRPKPVDATDPVVADDHPFVAIAGPGTLEGSGIAKPEILPPLPLPTPVPVLTGPSVDPRYARDLQPLYPASEQRAGREGLVTVRILVGPDGRVRQVERIAAASDAFFAATERQALARWRFRPATRDGVAVEGWRTMTVRFKISD